jgi:hypothetical protein
MSIATASLSQAAIADAGQAKKKVPPKRLMVVAATSALVPLAR